MEPLEEPQSADSLKRRVKGAVASTAERAQGAGRGFADRRLRRRGADPEPLPRIWPRSIDEFGATAAIAAETGDALVADIVTLGALVVGAELVAEMDGGDRDAAERIHAVVEERAAGLFAAVAGGESFDVHQAFVRLGSGLDANARRAAAIELWFVDPVAPFEIKYPRAAHRKARWRTLQSLGLSDAELRQVRGTIEAARRAHSGGTLKRVGWFGLGGAVVFATAGFLAAPVIAASLGAAAGLHGAAATAYGLSLLGGGSLAAGGAGMAGGVWLVTGVGAATGVMGAGGGRALFELGADQLRVEVIKLQATYRLLLLDEQLGQAKALKVAEGLDARIAELDEQIEYERAINDRNSKRVKALAEKLATLRAGREWVGELSADA